MKPTKWGIIGPGKIAQVFAHDLKQLNSPQKVQAVLGHTKKTTECFATEFDVPQVFMELDEFLDKADIDIVYVATPHTLHYEQVLACLQRKIPVLCEKPMTINADQCSALIAASQTYRTFLMEGMWIRFLPSIRQVMELVKNGRIGKITSIKAAMCYKAPQDSDSRYFDPSLGGGSLLDLGIYPIFLSMLLLGKPDTVKAVGTLSGEGVDEDCSILFHYKEGQRAILESSLTSDTEQPAEITGEKGMIRIFNPWFERPAGIELHLYDEGRVVYPCNWPGHGLQFETQEVLDCIENKKIESEWHPHQFSLNLITVLDEIRSQVRVTYELYE
ncbi:MAG: Gfo/Idh/MocA family oxidoreductase [Chitinophagaceae bacterium]|nr:Gfo/Idh/MocA family oxidoreductase [Chitinophagaceae bacterium]